MKLLQRLTVTLIAASIIGCTGLSQKPPEEIVGARALAQAEALRAGDFEVALQFMTPSYQAGPRARDYQHDRAGAVGWTSVDLKWVRCDELGSRCEVRLIIRAIRPPVTTTPLPIPLDDVWILVDGEWYQYD